MAERHFTKNDRTTPRSSGYTEDIDRAQSARNSQREDTNPMVEKEGFLGVDNIDKMRRVKIRNYKP